MTIWKNVKRRLCSFAFFLRAFSCADQQEWGKKQWFISHLCLRKRNFAINKIVALTTKTHTHAYNYMLIHVLLELTIFDSWLLLCCIWWLFPNNDNQLFYSVAKVKSQNKSRNNKIIVKIKCCVDLLYSRETRMQCRPKFTNSLVYVLLFFVVACVKHFHNRWCCHRHGNDWYHELRIER